MKDYALCIPRFHHLTRGTNKKNTTVKGLYVATHCEGGASDFAKYTLR